MNDITYPVVLTYEDNFIYTGVPDLGIDNYASFGTTLEEALKNAKELITLYLVDLEEEQKEFPKQSEMKTLRATLNENQDLVYINLWLPYEKSLVKIEYKKKTLSVPVWLDILATNKNINFSSVLKNALLKELEIKS